LKSQLRDLKDTFELKDILLKSSKELEDRNAKEISALKGSLSKTEGDISALREGVSKTEGDLAEERKRNADLMEEIERRGISPEW
jgi:predicted  nucleic acid-binding Zn-ribbon protein